MKLWHKITAAAAALLLVLGLGIPPAAAEEATAGDDWDSVLQKLMDDYGVQPGSIRAGYLNLVTGEEHYLNPDDYMVAASMYKVPLCMYVTEHIQTGDIDWSWYASYNYEELRDAALIDSSNDAAITLWGDVLGGYWNFRRLSAPYMGVEPDAEETWLFDSNQYTAREFITCLKLLYENPDRFPGILDCMLQAEPERFFRLKENRFDIAHKYGSYDAHLNDCGIVFTEEPIAIVMFTQGLGDPENFLADYCTAMCDYAESHKIVPTPEPTPVPSPEPVLEPESAPAFVPEPSDELLRPSPVALACIGAGFILFVLIVIRMMNKNKKRFFCFFLTLLFTAALLPALGGVGSLTAGAAEPEDDGEWDAIVSDLMAEYDAAPDAVRIGYLNLVTGEEHYVNPDIQMVAGSMYKLPLCMYFAEGFQNGTIDWSVYEQYFTFEDVRDKVLIESDNEQAGFLLDQLGGYESFRELTAPYMGKTAESGVQSDNIYTAREFISCLRTLYTERERFPDIIETLQKAEPNRFFKLNEPRFRIAHKYGYLDGNPYFMNDCGICFTTEPIAIVVFTRSLNDPENFLTDYCTAMCEYTERRVKAAAEPTPEPTPVPTAAPTPAPTAAPAVTAVETRAPVNPLIPAACVALFVVFGLVSILVLCARYRARFLGLFLALILSAAAMLLAVVGMHYGTVYAKPSGDPSLSVTHFFDAVCAGDYSAAYHELRDYSDLGLAAEPSSAAGQRIYKALHESYSYTLSGDCSSDKLEAVQPVRFTYLDLPKLEQAVADETQLQIERIVQTRSVSEVYDENKHYRPEVADEAYLAALDVVLQNAADYYADVDLELALSYTDGRWQILASPALLRALAGGIAY